MVVYSTDRLPVYRFVITVVAGISISVALAYNKSRLQEAEKQNRELYLEQEIARIQNEYSQSLVHDLRTPLSVLKTQTYLIQRRIENGESIANNLNQINNYVDKLSRMVDDFAHVSELTGFTPIVTNQMVDLEDTIESTISTLQQLCSEKNVHIHVIRNLGDTGLHISGHRDYIKQMFRHLLQNSIQFSPPGGEVILTLSADDSNVQIVIKDDGIGIKPEQQDHIFEMFYRGNEARTMEIDTGSGIGLAITKRIVDLHQGTISVKSEVNKGTTFTIMLPTSRS